MYRSAIQETSKVARLFVLAVCLILAVLEGWSIWRERGTVMDDALRATTNMSAALSLHAELTFDEVDVVLRSVLQHLQESGGRVSDPAHLHELLVENVAALPQLAGLFVYDEHGAWVVNSQPLLETRFNNSDRDYFVYHRTHRQNQPFIGQPIKSKSTGHWVLTVSRRVDKPDGTFGGVVLATLDLGFFERLYQQFDIGRSGVIGLGLDNGIQLFRRPMLDDSLGKDLRDTTLYRDHVSRRQAGSFETRSGQDGVLRVNSFKHLNTYPLFVVVGLAKDEVLHGWRQRSWRGVIGLGLLLALVYYGGIKIVRQVSLREAAQAEAVRAHEELEKMFVALEAQSQRDGLTGVFNRRYFDAAIETEVARFARVGGSLALLMIDVDHFKQFNDRHGHVAGDQCLKRVATAIAGAAQREVDVVARYGGEEFVVLLPLCEPSGALAVANRVSQAVRALAIPHLTESGCLLSVSVGLVWVTSDQALQIIARTLVEQADQALYRAKASGRGKVVCFDEPPAAPAAPEPMEAIETAPARQPPAPTMPGSADDAALPKAKNLML